MQRHRKWLVITIWVASIAFVGAGFVGWGSYDFNLNRTSSVAKVGDERVSFMEFNRRFAQLYDDYNKISGGTLTPELAKEQGLERLALNTIIEDKILINFAKSLGIGASEDEVIKVLVRSPEFSDENGDFRKEIYYKLLADNDIDAKDYEALLADSIVLNKLGLLFNLPVREVELKMLAANYFMQDSLAVDVVAADKNPNIVVKDDELKAFWEGHKNEFKTEKYYELSSFFMPAKKGLKVDEKTLQDFYNKNRQNYKDFNDKILPFKEVKSEVNEDYALEAIKDDANKAYLGLNKKELNFQYDENVTEMDVYYPTEQLAKAKPGTVLKPFVFERGEEKGFLIVRVNSINNVRAKSFDEAKAEVEPLFIVEKKKQLLSEKATKALEDFKGKEIGFVSRDSAMTKERADLTNDGFLNDAEFSFFLMNVFNDDKTKGFVLFDDKAVLYEIRSQNLLDRQKLEAYKKSLEQNLKNIKASQVRRELLVHLQNSYPVEIYYKEKN